MSQMSLMDIKLNVKRKNLKTTNHYTLLDIKYSDTLRSFILQEVF